MSPVDRMVTSEELRHENSKLRKEVREALERNHELANRLMAANDDLAVERERAHAAHAEAAHEREESIKQLRADAVAAQARINELLSECRSRLDHENRQRARADKAEADLADYRAECQEAHLATNADHADDIEAWKNAAGLSRGGDPDGVTPLDLQAEMARLRAQVEAGDALREACNGQDGYDMAWARLTRAMIAYDAAKGAT